MKSIYFTLLVIILGFSACKDDDTNVCGACEIDKLDRSAGAEYLNLKYTEIQTMAASVTCKDAADWEYVPIGSKACGGPTAYVAFSKTIDKVNFLKKVKDYTDAQAAFNKKWGLVSDCAFVTAPKSLSCIDGKVKLNY